MLDWTHRLVLRSVVKGEASESEALRDLVAAGLVSEREGGGYDVTPAGYVALGAGPGRWERIALIVGSLGLAVLAIDAVAGWLT